MLYARSTCQEQPRAQLNRYNHFAPAAGACVASFLLFVMWKRNSLKLVTSKECSTCACLCTYLRKAPQYIKTLALKKKNCWVFSRFVFCVVTITPSMNYFQSELSPRFVWMMFIQDWRLNRPLQLFSESLQDQCLSSFLGVHIQKKQLLKQNVTLQSMNLPPSPQQPSSLPPTHSHPWLTTLIFTRLT